MKYQCDICREPIKKPMNKHAVPLKCGTCALKWGL